MTISRTFAISGWPSPNWTPLCLAIPQLEIARYHDDYPQTILQRRRPRGGGRRGGQERPRGASRDSDHPLARYADALGSSQRPSLSSRRDLERLEPALAHAQRRQGV